MGGTDDQVPHVQIIFLFFFFKNIQGHVSNQMMLFKLKQRDVYSNNHLSVVSAHPIPKPGGILGLLKRELMEILMELMLEGPSVPFYCFIVLPYCFIVTQIKISHNFGKTNY